MTDRIDGQTAMVPLPTLPGCIHGIVGEHPGEGWGGKTAYDIQCDGCWAIETPGSLVVMTFLHWKCTRTAGGGPRLCPDCHADVHPKDGMDCR